MKMIPDRHHVLVLQRRRRKGRSKNDCYRLKYASHDGQSLKDESHGCHSLKYEMHYIYVRLEDCYNYNIEVVKYANYDCQRLHFVSYDCVPNTHKIRNLFLFKCRKKWPRQYLVTLNHLQVVFVIFFDLQKTISVQ
jgi:hypothetical protein